jgi:hypothetical protein
MIGERSQFAALASPRGLDALKFENELGEAGLIFRFHQGEPHGETDFERRVDNFAPGVDRFFTVYMDFQPEQFPGLYLATAHQKATTVTEAGDGGLVLLGCAFPASREIHFDSWEFSPLVLHR